MTEQTSTTQTIKERSANYAVCKLSYECLLSATKSFVHNYANLSDEEKLEFKSLSTYVKQLEKCLPSKQKLASVSKPKKAPERSTATDSVVEEKVVEPVKVASAGTKRGGKKVETKEVSPSSVVVEVAAPVVAASAPVEDKKPVQKKAVQSKSK